MKKSIKKLLVTCLTFSLILTQMFFTREAKAEEAKGTVKTAGSLRLGGSDRYKTSVAISQRGWSSSQYVVLASGIEFPDALCAGPLAKKYDAPILLTQPDKLNLDTLKEIKRLGAKNIIIIGGIGSISKNIEDELKSEGITSTERISGADRYETSVKVAEKIGTTDSIALACGLNFPDALSFSPIATAKGIPIVLTNKDSLPDCVKQYLTGKKIIQSYIVGGTGVISDSVKNSVSNPLRLGGLNRYETNVEILKAFDKDLNYNNVYISDGDGPNGNEFADALSGSVLAARTSSPIILAYKSLPDSTKDYIKTKFILGSKTIALGGEASVSSSILNDMSALINEIPASAVDNKTQTTTASQGSGGSISSNITLSVTGVSGKVILSSTAIEMQSGDTAYSVLIRKLGSKVSTKGSGYVRGIDGLKELDYGPLSGWMYSVNGKFPNVSADLYTLKNGDVVAWCYTKNMGQDIGAPMTGGSTGSGGGAGSGSGTNPTDNTNGNLVDIKGNLSFTLTEAASKTITIQSNSNNSSDFITVTLYDSNGNLAYINQCSNGTMQLNTILAPGKYHGFVKASSMDKVTISEFQVN